MLPERFKGAISYALFGHPDVRHESCFDFNSYLRGLMISIRMNRLVYPDWDTVVHINDDSPYKTFLLSLNNLPNVKVYTSDPAPLCKAMLWRLKPVFFRNDKDFVYTHVICRDLDSPTTYREAQCVQEWINHDKTVHAITDSISHTIPLMGGMIGFRPEHITMRLSLHTWNDMIQLGSYDFSRKGTDQEYLNQQVYPSVSRHGDDSITQHYIKGMPNTWLSDYHNVVPDIKPDWINDEGIIESNDSCGHIGASGYYPPPLHKFLNKYYDRFADIRKLEAEHDSIFFWLNENLF